MFLMIYALVVLLTVSPMISAGVGGGSDVEKTPFPVPKIDLEVKLDGILDDAFWDQTLVLELNYEVWPGENIKAPVRTKVFLGYTDTRFYAAFRAYDPDPAAIRARLTDRDKLWNDDWVALVLDTFNDQHNSYEFFCNPLGVQGDKIESRQGGETEWDGLWDSVGRIDDQGYVVEIAIPFSSLRFQRKKGNQVWGIDAVRSYPRNTRHHIGLFPRQRNNLCYMCQSEKLIGFSGIKPGKNLEFDPTVSTQLTQERRPFPEGRLVKKDSKIDPGLTARWGFTPNLTLSAAVNPDFSHVEADALQLDINTQFALYYPEKRPFFLEGASIFKTRFRVLHTRTFADPYWGIKLTGKEGANAIGFFSVRDSLTNLVFPGSQASQSTSLEMNNIGSVFRYSRDIGKSSSLGIFASDREGNDYYNRLVGMDGDLLITPSDRLQFQLLGSWTRYPPEVAMDFNQPADRFNGSAIDIYFLHNTRTFDYYLIFQDVSPNFRADLGYMPQANHRNIEVGWRNTWTRKPGHWWTMLDIGSSCGAAQDYDKNLLFKNLKSWFTYEGPLQSYLDLKLNIGKTTFMGKEFNDRFLVFDVGVKPSGTLTIMCMGTLGDRVDFANIRAGKRFQVQPYIDYKIGRHLSLAISHLYEKLDVEPGRLYTANISYVKIVYQLNRRTFLRTILQYINYNYHSELYSFPIDPRYRHLFTQVLFSYKINPQTVLFIGYSDNYFGSREIPLTQDNRTAFIKIGYALVL